MEPINEYFLKHVDLVATRSKCMARKVGCIIVKDKRIISLGYNGTPSGYKNCNEGGCKRCASNVKSGTHLDECLCTHSEANAISYSARNGINTNNAIMYLSASPFLKCAK